MRIEGISGPLFEGSKKKIKGIDRHKNVPPSSDSARLSPEGISRAGSDFSAVSKRVEGALFVRPEKIAEVRGKIENGFYDTPEFAGKLAEKIIQDFSLL